MQRDQDSIHCGKYVSMSLGLDVQHFIDGKSTTADDRLFKAELASMFVISENDSVISTFKLSALFLPVSFTKCICSLWETELLSSGKEDQTHILTVVFIRSLLTSVCWKSFDWVGQRF